MAYEIKISNKLSDYAKEKTEMTTTKVGKFSIDGSRSILHDDSSSRYLYSENIKKTNFNVDLNQGFKAYIERAKLDDGLDILLNWLNMRFPSGGNLKQLLGGADFITSCEVLAHITTSLYDKSHKWVLQAIRIKNVIFIQEVPPDFAVSQLSTRLETTSVSVSPISSITPSLSLSGKIKVEQPKSPTLPTTHISEEEKQALYRKAKLVQLMTIDKPGSAPAINAPINRKQAFVKVFHSTLIGSDGRKLEIFYSNEIDAVDKNGHLHQIEVVKGELDSKFWSTEAKKIWMQLQLMGGAGVLLGHCSESWNMNKISQFTCDQLEKNSKISPNASRALLFRVLNVINMNLARDGDTCTVKMTDDVILFEKPGSVTEFIDNARMEYFS